MAPLPTAEKNLILLAFYYLPDNTSGVQRAVRLAKYLPSVGSRCYVVCSSHAGVLADRPEVVHVPKQDPPQEVQRKSGFAERIQRLLPYNEQLPWVPHAVAAASELISGSNVTAVVSTSPPVATHLAALQLKRRHGIKWVADLRDPILGNPGRARAWAQPYDRAIQWLIFKNADAVIAVTDTVADEWRSRYPKWSDKFHVIWNGFDPEDGFGPLALPPRPYRTLSHVGVLYALRHPTALAGSIDRLVRAGTLSPDSFRLRFIGPIQEEDRFRAEPAAKSLIECGCLEISGTLVPRQQAMQEIATSDFLLLLDIVNLSRVGYTVPAKLYDYILAGRPILAVTDRNSPVDRILAQSEIPYTCLYGDESEASLDQKVAAFLSLPSDPVTPSSWFHEHFDGKLQAAKLQCVIDSLG
jgi:glycosyltransferase involved in cell wall biosynthesis